MLLSYINTKLRDECESLDEFCNVYNYPKFDIVETLDEIGYSYDEKLNQIK